MPAGKPSGDKSCFTRFSKLATIGDIAFDETRWAILALKEARAAGHMPAIWSIDVYRAVLASGVRTLADMHEWLETNQAGALTDWKPGKAS
ncbi:MAG: hypothetical protein LLG00_02175 [Planctomycetaceae bacterium]|nr:hypothetical protein [Planctomycetaceae bacterium]